MKILTLNFVHVLLLGFSTFGQQSKASEYSLWPKPRTIKNIFPKDNHDKVVINSKILKIKVQPGIPSIDNKAEKILKAAVKRYSSILESDHANIVDSSVESDEVNTDALDFLRFLNIRVHSVDDTQLKLDEHSDESYSLTIDRVGNYVTATLSSAQIWGALRGLETFVQLAESPSIVEVGLFIEHDSPEYTHRGLLIDSSRHYLPLYVIERTIRAMEASKLNVLHWHIVDATSFPFVSKSNPFLSKYGSYGPNSVYTEEMVSSIIAYGYYRGVRVIPEFDSPGHAYSWGLSKTLAKNVTICGAAEPWSDYCAEPPCGQLNPGNEQVLSDRKST